MATLVLSSGGDQRRICLHPNASATFLPSPPKKIQVLLRDLEGQIEKWRSGFWKGKMGSSRFLQITSGNVVLQLVLDEPNKVQEWLSTR